MMPVYKSLAIALRGHYHRPLASLPPDVQQRILEDFAPWPWDSHSPRLRCHLAKQWDYKNDPARREEREGIEALTNPASPSYSAEASRRLRGDYLPEPRHVKQKTVDLPPLDWEDSPPVIAHSTESSAPSAPSSFKDHAFHTIASASIPVVAQGRPLRKRRSDSIDPVIKLAQGRCSDPADTAEVWGNMMVLANNKNAPFLRTSEGGLDYLSKDSVKTFTRSALDKRLHPETRGKPGKRR